MHNFTNQARCTPHRAFFMPLTVPQTDSHGPTGHSSTPSGALRLDAARRGIGHSAARQSILRISALACRFDSGWGLFAMGTGRKPGHDKTGLNRETNES